MSLIKKHLYFFLLLSFALHPLYAMKSSDETENRGSSHHPSRAAKKKAREKIKEQLTGGKKWKHPSKVGENPVSLILSFQLSASSFKL